jgi:hypothetical protein
MYARELFGARLGHRLGQAGALTQARIADFEGLFAMSAHQGCGCNLPATDVLELKGWAFCVGEPAVAPLHQAEQYSLQIAPGLRQAVLAAWRIVLIGLLNQHTCVYKALQAIGQDIACDIEVLAEVVEAADAVEGFADDEQGPAVAQDSERTGDAAILIGGFVPAHVAVMVARFSECVAF